MSTKDKRIARLKSTPKDFTFDEMKSLLESLGFVMSNKGKTSGSRVCFEKDGIPIVIHKPHPGNILLEYQIKGVLVILEKEGLI